MNKSEFTGHINKCAYDYGMEVQIDFIRPGYNYPLYYRVALSNSKISTVLRFKTDTVENISKEEIEEIILHQIINHVFI